MYYKICEYCGAHLDPGERCDCRDITASYRHIKETHKEEPYCCAVRKPPRGGSHYDVRYRR